MLVEWNKDIDIFNAKKQNRPKELQIETKKCLPWHSYEYENIPACVGLAIIWLEIKIRHSPIPSFCALIWFSGKMIVFDVA